MTHLTGYNQSAACNNTYTVGCDSLSRRTHYCVCVNFLKALEEGRINESFADCQRSVRNGTCVAFNMREEEKEAGESLYYIPRTKKIVPPVDRPLSSAPSKRTRSIRRGLPSKLKVKTEDDMLVGADMAEMITAATKSESKKPTYPKPVRGESLLAFAKRFEAYESHL